MKNKLRFNYHTLKYEYAQDDMEPTFNEYESKYEYGYKESSAFNYYTGRYNKKGKTEDLCIKYNPYTFEYEQVPCDWEIRYNEYEQKYEFGPKD